MACETWVNRVRWRCADISSQSPETERVVACCGKRFTSGAVRERRQLAGLLWTVILRCSGFSDDLILYAWDLSVGPKVIIRTSVYVI